MGWTPFHQPSNELKHHFSNIQRSRICSSIGDQTWTPYFWLRTIGHQTSNPSVIFIRFIAYSCKLTFQTSENEFLRFDFEISEISIHVLHRFTFAIYRLGFQTWRFKKSTSRLKNGTSRSEIAFWTWIAFSEVEKCNLEVSISEVGILKVWKVDLHE